MVLAWSRDGRTWQRDEQPFLLNDPDPARALSRRPNATEAGDMWAMGYVTTDDGVRLYYEEAGTGEPILFTGADFAETDLVAA